MQNTSTPEKKSLRYYFYPELLDHFKPSTAHLICYLLAKQIYLAKNNKGYPYYTKKHLAQVLHCSEKTIERSIREARKNKLLIVKYNRRAASTYAVLSVHKFLSDKRKQQEQNVPFQESNDTPIKYDKHTYISRGSAFPSERTPLEIENIITNKEKLITSALPTSDCRSNRPPSDSSIIPASRHNKSDYIEQKNQEYLARVERQRQQLIKENQ